MIEFLLLVLIVVVWQSSRRKKDWYVVEWRACSDRLLASHVLSEPPMALDKSMLSAHGLSLNLSSLDGAIVRREAGGECAISQVVFEDHDAALMYIEQLKGIIPDTPRQFQKLYLWRIVARSRRAALTLPPEQYSAKDGEVLIRHPEKLWLNFKSEEASSA